MAPGAIRTLSSGEQDLARGVFGAALDTKRIRLFALPWWSRAFVAGGRFMIWPARSALRDFATASLSLRATFVHELTHVWQAQTGVNLLTAKLRAGDSDKAYGYDLSTAVDFANLNIEQQAMIIEHAYLASVGGTAPYDSRAYADILATWPGSDFVNPQQV